MPHVHYETESRRLRLAGDVLDDDLADLREAVARFVERSEGHLMVDLTAVTDLSESAARHLVEVRTAAGARGRRITLLRRHGTPVDEALRSAAASG